MAFHVYVEGPAKDRSPAGIQRLAEAISSKYGLPLADLVTRLTAGRFRVKANVDRATAETYVKALEEVGAKVKMEEATTYSSVRTGSASVPPPTRSGAPSIPPTTERVRQASTPPPLPARSGGSSLPPATTSRPAVSSLPPPTTPRPTTSSLPPATVTRTATPASGLSAAFTPDTGPAQTLGALDDDSLSLASLEGDDDAPAIDTSSPVPNAGLPATFGPATTPAPAPAAKAKSKSTSAGPLDLFAPPDAEELEAQVNIAPEEVEDKARRMNTPPAGVPVQPGADQGAASSPAKRRSEPRLPQIPMLGGTVAPETPRWRLAAGVLLAILLGFLPANLIASAREQSAFSQIDATVVSQQLQADTPETYEALDSFRDAKLSEKESTRRMIALTSMLIWAAVSVGLAYVWFRRIPWHRLGKPTA